jgi:hypothetical protein
MMASVVMLDRGSEFLMVAAGHALQHGDERRSLGKIAEHSASALDVPRSVCAVEDRGRCVLRKCVCNVRESCAAQVFKVWMTEPCGGVFHNMGIVGGCVLMVKEKSA